jgi:diguanylate cyclase (GGDEF)-like protein
MGRPMPDFHTLFLVVLLLGLSHCIIWGLVVYRYRELRAARYWLAGSAVGVIGGLVLALQGNDGLIVETVVGNFFLILGFYLNWVGLRRFHGARSEWPTVMSLLGSSLVLMFSTFYPWYARNPIYTLMQLLPLVITAIFLLRRHGGELGAVVSSAAMIVASISHGVIAGGNILIVIGFTPDLDLKTAAAVDLLVFLFAAVVWNFGFLLSAVDRLRSEVERLANEDELTGLANRRMLMNRLTSLCGRGNGASIFSVMLFDLDRFKAINDQHGHAAGDAALRHAATVIAEQLGSDDMFARLGGDEFCLLLPTVPANDAAARARRIINALKAAPLQWGDIRLMLTTSIGIVCCSGERQIGPADLLDQADRALYETKRRGRNGYSVHGQKHWNEVGGNVIRLDGLTSGETTINPR